MERQNQGMNELSKLPLEELLDRLAAASVEDADTEALEQEILAREGDAAAFFPDVEAQWEQFQALYLPMEKEAALGEGDHLQVGPYPAVEVPDPVPKKRTSRSHRVWRTAVAAVIAAACMAAVMLSGQTIGVDVFGVRLRWTGELFPFGQDKPERDAAEYWEEMLLGNGSEPGNRF